MNAEWKKCGKREELRERENKQYQTKISFK